MSLSSWLTTALVTLAAVAVSVREYRFTAQAPTRGAAILHLGRILGVLLVSLGVVGQVLQNAGYGGAGPTLEVTRWHPLLGNLGTGYREGPTRLAKLSAGLGMVGIVLLLLCTFGLWGAERRRRASQSAGA
jgi:ABC-type Na+ efflux pump permease subunit